MKNVKVTNEFNRELEVIMIKNKWEASDIAKMTGYCTGYISAVKCGKAAMSPKFMSRIARLDLTKEELERLMTSAHDLYLENKNRNWDRLMKKYMKETKKVKA